MVAIFLSGILAYQFLPVSSLPQIDYPTIQVSTFYAGASPNVMNSSVTAPLEKQFGQMPGLVQMTSSSGVGLSLITLQFDLDLSLDVAEQEVQAAINAGLDYLPSGLTSPPVYSKVNPADAPIITLALTSKTIPLSKIEDFAETRLVQKISQVSGVGLVAISGGHRPAVKIQANPLVLASYGISLDDISASVSGANVNAAKGSFDGKDVAYIINANDHLLSGKDYRELVIAYKNNAPVRLQDVAIVTDDIENSKQAAWISLGGEHQNEEAIIINIQRQPGANSIKVADSIKELIAQITPTLPGDLKLTILSDRTVTIRAGVADVKFELILSILLVIAVLLIFLHDFSAAIIPGIAVPLSLVGSLGMLYLLEYSINNLSLMALTVATGFVVDDAIVMIENITRYIEKGMKPMEAAFKGAAQIGFTILSLTISLIAVLIPLFFMDDIIGRLFREFAVTLAITIVISAFISLSLTPMLCSRILKPEAKHGVNKLAAYSSRLIDQLINQYGRSLKIVLAHRHITLFVAIMTLVATGVLFYFIPKGFFPVQDTGVIQGISEGVQNISFDKMAEKQQELNRIVAEDPAIESLSSFIGIDGIKSIVCVANKLFGA
jgi:multidrug efflux pump